MKRSSGMILPVFSLPSPHGIGTLGQAAYDFIDFLRDAGQSWWQMLPLGPTGYGDSPYQSLSAYAGNPYFIDLELLAQEGLLTREEIAAQPWGAEPNRVDYSALYAHRLALLQKAARRGIIRGNQAVDAFLQENRHWLPDYALYMAVKEHFGHLPWTQWPEEGIRLRRPEALAHYRQLLAEEIETHQYIQFLFFRQWDALCRYAHSQGIGIIGDMPIYVSMDSADVWTEPQFFQLDSCGHPTEVAGVPPDSFSADGQLWGNPLYDWEAMAADGYGWWIRRVDGAAKLYDVIRLDHFRGFESYWAVPYGETTAQKGRWRKGPGMDLIGVLLNWFPQLRFIAEDLGYLTPQVHQLLADSGLPGMKVLAFAFDAQEPSNYLPHLFTPNCVCYTGTHDNAPLRAWLEETSPEDLAFAAEYLGLSAQEGVLRGLLRGGLSSVAELFVAQVQDYLGLGAQGRINTPGTVHGNWQWRLLPGQLDGTLAARIARLTRLYGR